MKADVASCVLTYTYMIKETNAAVHEGRHNKSSTNQSSQNAQNCKWDGSALWCKYFSEGLKRNKGF